MRLLLWVIVGVVLAYAGLQFWRAWRLGAFRGLGRSGRSRPVPPPPPADPYAFDLPEGPDVLGDRSEPGLAPSAWDLPPASASPFAPPPAATPPLPTTPAFAVPPHSAPPPPPAVSPALAPAPAAFAPAPAPPPLAPVPPSFAPEPPPFTPEPPPFVPAPPPLAPVPPAFRSAQAPLATPLPDGPGPDDEETSERTTTHDEVLQVFERDLRALRHAIEVQRNTLGRLEADLHMLEKHLNGRQAPRRS